MFEDTTGLKKSKVMCETVGRKKMNVRPDQVNEEKKRKNGLSEGLKREARRQLWLVHRVEKKKQMRHCWRSDQPSIKQPGEGPTLTHMQLQYITHSCSSFIKCFCFCLRDANVISPLRYITYSIYSSPYIVLDHSLIITKTLRDALLHSLCVLKVECFNPLRCSVCLFFPSSSSLCLSESRNQIQGS